MPFPIRMTCNTLAAATVLAAALAGCKKGDPPPAAAAPPEVQTAFPQQRGVTDFIEYTGNTEALAQVDLRARVSGYLEKINFTEGRPVKKGDLLFVIEKAQYQAAVDRAAADLSAKKASLAGAEADAQLAAELADQRAGPEIDRVLKAARRDASKAAVEEAEATLQNAKLNLGYCDVYAPVDGVITKKFVDVGNLVGGLDPTTLATIVASKPIYVSIAISEADMLRGRRAGMAGDTREPTQLKAFVALSDEKAFKIEGRVDYMDPAVDRQTGTIGMRMIFENEDGLLIPGMFVRTRIPLDTTEQLVVAQAAISQDQAGYYVLTVGPDGTVARKRVQTGAADGEDRVILDGLTTGDSVIVQGVQRARVGSKVTAKPVSPPAANAGAAGAGTAAPEKPSLRHGATRDGGAK